MKILQLVTKRQYRGAEVFAANLSEELIELGHQIVFAGLYANTENILSVNNAKNIDLQGVESVLSYSLVKDLIRLVKEERPEVIQCNGSDTLKYMISASFFLPKVPIVYRNISIISKWVDSMPKKILYKALFSRVSHISSVGSEAAEDFIETFNYNPSKVSVTRRGIPIREIKDTELKEKYRSELGLCERHKIAIHVGNFSSEKNHSLLLDVFEGVDDDDIKLICVGTGEKYEEIRMEIINRNLQEKIMLLGFRQDIPELLAISDCFVLSSFVEGVPGVILEAAAQRIPSVATNVGGVSEVLLHGETGYLVENFDKHEFLEKMLEILLNEPLRKELGEKAYKLVQGDFNPVANARKFEKLYAGLVASL